MHASDETDELNYATKCRTKMQAKLSCCDQIKFNDLVWKPGKPE